MMDRKAFVMENTQIMTPFLCPEMRLHLITDACPLWRATEKDLTDMKLDAPYWGFCWAGGHALARCILDNPEMVAGRRVLDFGAGCGVEAIAAMQRGAASVLAADIDPLAVEAIALNAELNGVVIQTTTEDLIGVELGGIDVVLAGDMFYDPDFSVRVLDWLVRLPGPDIFIGDPGRGNLSATPLRTMASYQAPSDVDLYGKHLLETTVYAVERSASQ